MRREEFMEALRSRRGIDDVLVPDGTLLKRLFDEESGTSAVGGAMRYDPVGMRDCLSMDTVLIMRCGDGFDYPSFLRMEMVDDSGTVIGHNIGPDEAESYKGRDDIIWISDNFIMYAERVTHHDASMRIYSQDYQVDDICDGMVARIYYPTMSSCAIVDSVYGEPPKGTCTAILGVSGIGKKGLEDVSGITLCGESVLQKVV